VANALQILSLVFYPISRTLFRRINRQIAQGWWGLSVFWSEIIHRTKPIFTGDPVPELENAIVISNHQQMPDVVALMTFAWRKKRLGDMKWFAKDVIRYVPGIGWGMQFLDCVFLKREWDRDEQTIRQTFAKFLHYDIPMWLVSFPEGTRLTESKLASSNAFAAKSGIPGTTNVLLPRTRGFAASVIGLREHVDAIYDVTIGYPAKMGVPSMWDLFTQVNGRYHMQVRRYPIEKLPVDEAGLSAWIMERFREKDARMAAFKRDGFFRA